MEEYLRVVRFSKKNTIYSAIIRYSVIATPISTSAMLQEITLEIRLLLLYMVMDARRYTTGRPLIMRT